jgi:type II secretory pathway component PulF
MTEPSDPLDYASSSTGAGSPPSTKESFSLGVALPAAVFLGGLFLILVLVVPRLETVFKDFGTKLPVVTEIVLNASRWFRSAYYAWLIVPALVVAAGVFAPRSKEGRRWLRLMMIFLFAGVVLALAWAVFAPMLSLIENISGSKR